MTFDAEWEILNDALETVAVTRWCAVPFVAEMDFAEMDFRRSVPCAMTGAEISPQKTFGQPSSDAPPVDACFDFWRIFSLS